MTRYKRVADDERVGGLAYRPADIGRGVRTVGHLPPGSKPQRKRTWVNTEEEAVAYWTHGGVRIGKKQQKADPSTAGGQELFSTLHAMCQKDLYQNCGHRGGNSHSFAVLGWVSNKTGKTAFDLSIPMLVTVFEMHQGKDTACCKWSAYTLKPYLAT